MAQRKFRSIKSKLVYLLSFSAMLGILLSSVATFIHTVNIQKTKDVQALSQLTEIIALNLFAVVEFDDEDGALSILETLESDKNIQAAYITSGEDWFASHVRDGIEDDDVELLLENITEIQEKSTFDYINFNYIVIKRPISLDNETIGSLTVIADTEALKNTLFEQLIVQFIAALLALAAITMLAIKLQRMFTTPIITLGRAINYISSSNRYDIEVETESNDEFQGLFNGFNKMVTIIKDQNGKLEKSKQEIEEIHKHTRESIEYASLIQGALIPESEQFHNCFDSYFSLWHPKDIVGGDIYFFEELSGQDEYLLMVIDCTGHGVPGAFVTMLVKAIERQIISTLRNSKETIGTGKTLSIFDSSESISPAKILSIFNKTMKQILKQEDMDSISNAGFDGGIIYYNKQENIIKFSGAETPLFYVADGELSVIKGSRHSIGYKKSDVNYEFKEHTIEVKKGMQFYLTTDGYLDQNGGEKGFCFGKKRFQKIILDNYQESMADQQELFLHELAKYQGQEERNDDVTVIGFKI